MRTLLGLVAVLAGTICFSCGVSASTLLGADKTVQSFYLAGGSSTGLIPAGGSTSDPASLLAPVTFPDNQSFGFASTVFDTQIVITNLVPLSFCVDGSVGAACGDTINGFRYRFTGENITSVTVDLASAPGFLPVTGTFQGNTHLGLQLISPNEILIDVTGADPNVNDQLILDVTVELPIASSTPLPAALPLFAAGLGGLGLLGWRRKRQALAA
jgi:hypothetical protein